MVPLKCLSNFWRTPAVPLINCEINLNLTWSDKCVLSNDTKIQMNLTIVYKIKRKPIRIITSYCRKKFQTNKTRIYRKFSMYF